MTSTLTVPEAVDYLLGSPSDSSDFEARMRERIEAARELEADRVAACVEILAPCGGGEDSDPRVLEALLISGLTHPNIAQEWGIAGATLARRLSGRIDRDGDILGASAVLRVTADHLPGNRAVERALASLMRRQGMAEDLVERYLSRAQALLDEGRKQEAIPWLREILLLDRSRKDVARMIRDLQYEEVARRKSGKRRVRLVLAGLAGAALVTLLSLREIGVRKEYNDLETAATGDLGDLRDRLASLEEFIAGHPLWHGSFEALSDRGELRVEIDRRNTELLTHRESEAETRRSREAEAEQARNAARSSAEAGDMQKALEEMQRALEFASDDWPHRERTLRDIEALRDALEGQG